MAKKTKKEMPRAFKWRPALPAPGAALKPFEAAQAAGLRYVSDQTPGIRRKTVGKGFAYFDPSGQKIEDPDIIARIRALAIPPAWRMVWISDHKDGHIQATGFDSKGRKQYIYHPRWHEVRADNKYAHITAFAKALPKIREQTQKDLSQPGLSRDKILAALVELLEKTLIRVGNEEYAKAGGNVYFKFRGKSGIYHRINLQDRRLARVIKHLQDMPGQHLFQYMDESGQIQSITSSDVNEYLRRISGMDFTAKDFRTWAGTVLAAMALRGLKAPENTGAAKKTISQAIQHVAQKLGNTPSICRKCYVHPLILEAYANGLLDKLLQNPETDAAGPASETGLNPHESALLAFLERSAA